MRRHSTLTAAALVFGFSLLAQTPSRLAKQLPPGQLQVGYTGSDTAAFYVRIGNTVRLYSERRHWVASSAVNTPPPPSTLRALAEGRKLYLEVKSADSVRRYEIAAYFPDSSAASAAVENGEPQVAVDRSQLFPGRIYVSWCDNKSGNTNKDIFLSWSDDGGKTWPEPVVVTYRPNHKHQFMPALSVDAHTGTVYLLYYDQQNSPDNSLADVYLAQSSNGGLLFTQCKVNTRPIAIGKGGYATALCAASHSICLAWLQAKGRGSDLYALVLPSREAMGAGPLNTALQVPKTIAWSDTLCIPFTLLGKARVSAVVTQPADATAPPRVLMRNKPKRKGQAKLCFVPALHGLKKATYTLTFYAAGQNEFVWLVAE